MVKQTEERWVYLDHPLHAVAYALDPEHQLHDWHQDSHFKNSLSDVIERCYGEDVGSIAAAERQLEECRTRQGRLGRVACVSNMSQQSGWRWWSTYIR